MGGTNSAIILLAATLFISLIIERLLEVLNSLYVLIELKMGWYKYWNSKAERLRQQLQEYRPGREADNTDPDSNQSTRARIIGPLLSRLKVEQGPYANVDSISAKKVRTYSIKFASKMIGVILGIGIALIADIDIFRLIDQMLHPMQADSPEKLDAWGVTLQQVVTGIAMGLGSGPLHKIIRALEKAKKKRKSA